jgi:tetratricopeptide (TPR) repeat protein
MNGQFIFLIQTGQNIVYLCVQSMDINKSIQSAFQYYQTGDLRQAKLVCTEILKEQPDNEDILYLLGIVLTRLEEYDSAVMHLESLLRLNKNNADGYLALGAIFQTKGLFDEAIKYYRKAVEIDPEFAEAYVNLGDIFRDRQRLDEAVAYYKKAVLYLPDEAEIYCKLGNIFKAKRQFDLAAYYYRKTLLYDADYAEAHNNLGSILLEQKRLDEAISHYRKALRISPDISGVRMNLDAALHKKVHFDESVKNYNDWLGFAVRIGSVKIEMLINAVINQFYVNTLDVQSFPDVNYDENQNAAFKKQILHKIFNEAGKFGNVYGFFSDLDRLYLIKDYFANPGKITSPLNEKEPIPLGGKPEEVAAFERLHKEFISTASEIEAQLTKVLGSWIEKR